MFQYPATELFNQNGDRRVVWSHQEFEEALSLGWSEERPVESAQPEEAVETVEAEEPATEEPTIPNAPAGRKCGKCGKPGHTAPKCPEK